MHAHTASTSDAQTSNTAVFQQATCQALVHTCPDIEQSTPRAARVLLLLPPCPKERITLPDTGSTSTTVVWRVPNTTAPSEVREGLMSTTSCTLAGSLCSSEAQLLSARTICLKHVLKLCAYQRICPAASMLQHVSGCKTAVQLRCRCTVQEEDSVCQRSRLHRKVLQVPESGF